MGLRQLQDALNRKADSVQREFIEVSDQLQAISRNLLEVHGEERQPLIAQQDALHERQAALAEEINLWRQRARAALQQSGDDALRAFTNDLLEANDEAVRGAAAHVLRLLDASEEELARMAQGAAEVKPTTPAGRLIERARTEYDLRGTDPAPRHKAAIEFANRSGMGQDDQALAEIEAAIDNPDPLVADVATLTAIQLHRFRALRLADLDTAHASVERVARMTHPAAVAVLVAVLENPRTGFVAGPEEPVEGNNARSRLVALKRLIEWHTLEAQKAVQACQLDRDPQIAQIANRALELFPDEWRGPLKGTGILGPAGASQP